MLKRFKNINANKARNWNFKLACKINELELRVKYFE